MEGINFWLRDCTMLAIIMVVVGVAEVVVEWLSTGYLGLVWLVIN